VQPGSTNAQNIIIEDIFPTVLTMAGIQKPKLVQKIDGQDIFPLIQQKSNTNKRFLYWHYPHIWGPKGPALELYSVIRQGHWKLIYFHTDQRFELYNTEADLGETQNLFSAQHSVALKLAKELGRALKKGRAEMPKEIATQRNVPYPDDLIKMRAR
jgi:arylsulfatase A-like enzyme